jgi:hypothetical protein
MIFDGDGLVGLFLFGVALPAFFADFIQAGFGGGGFFRDIFGVF